MSKLSQITVATESIPVGGKQSIDVRGLSFDDVAYVLNRHKESIVLLYGRFVSGEIDVSDALAKDALMDLIAEMPALFSDVVATANDDREAHEVVRRLPLPVQVTAIQKIFGLTFESEEDVKKLVAVVTEMIESMTSAITAVMPPSNTPET